MQHRDFCDNPRLSATSRLLGLLAFGAAVLASVPVNAASPPELPTKWQVPPGDWLEQETAGFAKVLCSAIFVTGRDFETAAEEDGFFVSPRASRAKVVNTVIDHRTREVRLSLPNGVTRTARLVGDQGCVTLPRGVDKVFFTPVPVKSALPDAATKDWPMGDRPPDLPLPPEIDGAKLEDAVAAAFDPREALTAAFVAVYKGRLIAERYLDGLDYRT